MDDTVTFIGTFHIPNREAWLPAIEGMTEFVASHVPGVLSFHAYANAEGTEGTVVYVHPDADSLDQHLAAAAELIEAGTQMVDVVRIELLGSPHPETVDRLRAGGLPVSVKRMVQGFDRR